MREFLTTVFEDAGATVVTRCGRRRGPRGRKGRAAGPDQPRSVDARQGRSRGILRAAQDGRRPQTSRSASSPVIPEFREVVYERPVPPPEGYLEKPVDEDKLISYAAHIIEIHESHDGRALTRRCSVASTWWPSPLGDTAGRGGIDGVQPGSDADAGRPPPGRLGYRQYWEEMPCYLSVHDREFRIIDGNRRFREDFGDRIGDYCYQVYKGRDEVCPDCPVEATFDDGTQPRLRAAADDRGRRADAGDGPHHSDPRRRWRGGGGDGDAHRHREVQATPGRSSQRSQERLRAAVRGGAVLHHRAGPGSGHPARQPEVPRDLRSRCRRHAPASRCTSTARSSAWCARRRGPSRPGSPSTTRRC